MPEALLNSLLVEFCNERLFRKIRKGQVKRMASMCDSCANYRYDEEQEYYYCDVNLDEDEMSRFMSNTMQQCSFYQLEDEYGIVRKQI